MSVIEQIVDDLKEIYSHNDGAHDWDHIRRVWQTARAIQAREGGDATVIELAALTHDLIDRKLNVPGFQDYDDVERFLAERGVEADMVARVLFVIKHVSYMSEQPAERNLELDVTQDADRLDALGAIGIARTFITGQALGIPLYDPAEKPQGDIIGKGVVSRSSIGHFYDKILRIKEKMNTRTGLTMAQERHGFVEKYLEQFYKEWQ